MPGKMAIVLAGVMLFAGSAQAQEPQPFSASALRAMADDTRLQDPKPPAPPQDQEDDDDPTRGWNRMKRGFYAGLIAGGIYGAVMAIRCGHPECGPLVTLAAGAGAGIGLTIDLLLVPEQPSGSVAAPRDRTGAMPFTSGRRVGIGFRKSW
jgi:hypothetical protein